MKRGLVLGKFLPPHAGHLYLVEVAKRMCDELCVVVGSLAREPIPGELRVRWMRELFPDVQVVHLTDENPQYPEEHPEFWNIWKTSLSRVLPTQPDIVFSSEAYGTTLAEVLGARSVVVDPERVALPVSGTAVREDPFGNWQYLPAPVRAHFAKRVVVFGPESTGKTTLARRLAQHFETRWVPEFARAHLEAQSGKVTLEDIELIARGQRAAEDALARDANRILFCDTDMLATELWSDALFGSCPEWIRKDARARRYPLTLLCDVDVPFVPDAVRYLPNARREFFESAKAALESGDRRFVRISGDWETRFSAAVAAVESLLETRTK